MSDYSDPVTARRKFLKLVGGSAVLLPLAGLAACSSEKEAPAPAAPAAGNGEASGSAPDMAKETKPAMEEKAPTPSTPAESSAAESGMPKLTEDDAQAKALGYAHDATQVDASKYPRYQAGQQCSNCVLFQGQQGDEWAGCSIFPGKLVNANGWCSAYQPRA